MNASENVDGAVDGRISMRRRVEMLSIVVVVSFLVREVRSLLIQRPAHEALDVFPDISLGFYAVATATAIALLVLHAQRHQPRSTVIGRHSLLFVLIAGLSLDLVLNNYGEVGAQKDGSYGLIVCIDFLVFILFFVVTTMYLPEKGDDYRDSSFALLVPVLPFVREIAYMDRLFAVRPETVDLLAESGLMVSWILLPYGIAAQKRYRRISGAAKFVFAVGLMYWALMIAENVLSHVLGLEKEISRLQEMLGGSFHFNVLYLGMSLTAGLTVFWVNPFNLRNHFGAPCSATPIGHTRRSRQSRR